MGELPVLFDDGSIRWASRDAALAEWDRTVGRGVVVVQTTRTFAPLEPVRVRVDVEGLSLDLDAEVIRPESGRATLRLIAGPVPLPAALLMRPAHNPFAAAPVVVTPASNPFAAPPAAALPPAAAPPAPQTAAGPSATTSSTTLNPFGLRSEPLLPVLRIGDDDDDDGAVMPPPPPRPAAPAPVLRPVLPLDVSQMTSTSMKIIALDDAPSPPLPALDVDQMTSTSMKAVVLTSGADAAPQPAIPPPPTAEAPVTAPAALTFPPVLPAPRPPAAEQTSTAIKVVSVGQPEAAAVAPPLKPVDLDVVAPAAPLPPPVPQALPTLAVMAPAPVPAVRPIAPTPVASATQVIDAAPLRTVLPPYFSGDCLRFNSLEDLRAARGDLQTVGALLAVSDASAPGTAVDVRVAAGSVESRGRVKVTISGAQKGTVVVQASRREDWKAVLDEFEAPTAAAPIMSVSATPAPATGAVAVVPGGVALQFPRTGHLTNPVTVQGILAMPLHRSVTEHDLKTPSVPLLLRWLRTTRGIFRLDLTADGVPAYTCILVDGREVRSPVALVSLGKSMAHHKFSYELTELPRAPTMSHTGRSLHLIIEVVRGLLAHHEPDEIAAVFPHMKDGRAVRAVGSVADALGFQGPHARLVKSSMQGDVTVAQVSRGAAGGRAAFDVLVALELFGGLAFSGEGGTSTPLGTPVVASAAAPERPAILDKDHFEALGLHWSCAPGAIAEAWQRARREYGAGGFKRPADPRIADEVMKKLDDAWRVLGTADSRRAYRRATFNMVWPHQAQLLVQQAKLAVYRKDALEARSLLEAAQDMSPSPEAQQLLDAINKS